MAKAKATAAATLTAHVNMWSALRDDDSGDLDAFLRRVEKDAKKAAVKRAMDEQAQRAAEAERIKKEKAEAANSAKEYNNFNRFERGYNNSDRQRQSRRHYSSDNGYQRNGRVDDNPKLDAGSQEGASTAHDPETSTTRAEQPTMETQKDGSAGNMNTVNRVKTKKCGSWKKKNKKLQEAGAAPQETVKLEEEKKSSEPPQEEKTELTLAEYEKLQKEKKPAADDDSDSDISEELLASFKALQGKKAKAKAKEKKVSKEELEKDVLSSMLRKSQYQRPRNGYAGNRNAGPEAEAPSRGGNALPDNVQGSAMPDARRQGGIRNGAYDQRNNAGLDGRGDYGRRYNRTAGFHNGNGRPRGPPQHDDKVEFPELGAPAQIAAGKAARPAA